jgi:hypothetical protein
VGGVTPAGEWGGFRCGGAYSGAEEEPVPLLKVKDTAAQGGRRGGGRRISGVQWCVGLKIALGDAIDKTHTYRERSGEREKREARSSIHARFLLSWQLLKFLVIMATINKSLLISCQ